jgi:cytochrome c-type biogenesis protein
MTSDAPSVLVAVLGGVVSFLSPCVLPLVPGYLSLMSGMSVADATHGSVRQRSRVGLSALLFIAGFSLVFIAYGAAASELGTVLVQHKRLLTHIAGFVMVVMGLALSGALRWGFLLRERRLEISPAQYGPYAAPVMGMAFALGWTPCIGPVLASVLTLAASRDTLQQGVLLLTFYSLGLGIPFLVSALVFDKFASTWGWFKRHAAIVNAVSGAFLILFGLVLLTGQLGRLSTVVSEWWSALGLDRLQLG